MKDYTEFRRMVNETLEEGIVRDTAIRIGRGLGIEKAKRAQTSGEESAERKGKSEQRSGSVDEVETGEGTRYRARWEDEFRYFDTWSDAKDWVEEKKRPEREAQSRRDAEEREQAQRWRESDERERERSRRRTPATRYNPHSGHDEPVDEGFVRDTAIRIGRGLGIEKAKRAQTSGEKRSAEKASRANQRSGTVDEIETSKGIIRYRARWEDEFRYFGYRGDAHHWLDEKKSTDGYKSPATRRQQQTGIRDFRAGYDDPEKVPTDPLFRRGW